MVVAQLQNHPQLLPHYPGVLVHPVGAMQGLSSSSSTSSASSSSSSSSSATKASSLLFHSPASVTASAAAAAAAAFLLSPHEGSAAAAAALVPSGSPSPSAANSPPSYLAAGMPSPLSPSSSSAAASPPPPSTPTQRLHSFFDGPMDAGALAAPPASDLAADGVYGGGSSSGRSSNSSKRGARKPSAAITGPDLHHPYLPPPQDKTASVSEHRRRVHNAAERARRDALNSRFYDLAAVVPSLSGARKPSKWAIVSRTLEHVEDLKSHIGERDNVLQRALQQQDELVQEVNRMRSMLGMNPIDPPELDADAAVSALIDEAPPALNIADAQLQLSAPLVIPGASTDLPAAMVSSPESDIAGSFQSAASMHQFFANPEPMMAYSAPASFHFDLAGVSFPAPRQLQLWPTPAQ
ncbi:hypothetical protein DFJ73DRAFT_795690 [Zopfochytrium polystomum]|nr:hypothetical protein DFJ73DRAFT_795690 [Zopfochytrium polystomum]